MKEELLQILNIKLKYIDDNIQALSRMNTRLELENSKLDYIKEILSLFEDSNGNYDILKFEKIDRDNFNKLMMDLDDKVLAMFGTNSCNYDGLIYLISGINKGISLTLTDEQKHSIEFLIDSIVNRQMDYLATIDGILLAKSRLEISDMDALVLLKEKYSNIVRKIEKNDYISEIDEIIDAMNYVGTEDNRIVEIFTFLLKYNADIYHNILENNQVEAEIESSNDLEEDSYENEENIDESKPIDLTVPFSTIDIDEEKINIPIFEETGEELPPINFDVPNFSSLENANEDNDVSFFSENELEESSILEAEDTPLEDNNDLDLELPTADEFQEASLEEPTVSTIPIDEDFKDLVDEKDYEDYKPITDIFPTPDLTNNSFAEEVEQENEPSLETIPFGEETNEVSLNTLAESDVNSLLTEYKIKYDELDSSLKEQLLTGNLENYREVLTLLREKDLLDLVETNSALLVNMLTSSSKEMIEYILTIIEKDLSVDATDRRITTKIVIMALPSIFIKEPVGNYETFKKNIASFKRWKIDLINLFDFSREMFVMNNDIMCDNYEIIKSYGLTVNDKNAKYYLVLPHIEEKLDYYVESVVRDNMKGSKGETFDGSEYVRLYPSKLNTVSDLTIKRLKYSSENGKKIFGSKEKSLAGEITNLKVDVLTMEDEYLRKYFNNEFDMLTRQEISEYTKIIQNNKDNDLALDATLESLEKYKNGLRYVLDGVNISYNKLVRNYNALVKHNISKDKALIFAACYNSVITKNEYQKVKDVLSNLGGR